MEFMQVREFSNEKEQTTKTHKEETFSEILEGRQEVSFRDIEGAEI